MDGFGIMSGVQAGLGLLGGIVGKFQHDKYSDLIKEQELNMPGSMGSAESIYQGIASQGLPGKENIQSDIEGTLASTMSAGKEVVDSPSALIDILTKSSANVAAQTRNLGVQDAQAKISNQGVLADFYTRAKAPMEMQINQFEIQKELDAQREKMLGWKELFGGATGAGNVGMQYFSNIANQDYMKELMELVKGGGTTTKSNPITGGDIMPDTSIGGNDNIYEQPMT